MRIQITFKGFDKQDKKNLRTLINEKAVNLEQKLGSLLDSDVGIRGTLEKNSKHDLYRFGVTLHLPHKMIAAQEEGASVREVISKTFKELERQAQKHKSRLKNEHLWKREARRKKLKSKRLEALPDTYQTMITDSENWFEIIKPYLDDLYHFAVHEITYLQAVGDLTSNDILPDELLDAVIVSAFEQQKEKPDNLDIKAWLYQIAVDIIDKEVEESQQRRNEISLETVIPDRDIDTTIFEFYQPDEMLELKDLIGVSDQIPETEKQQAIAEQTLTQSALTGMPRNWRRTAMLHYALGFPAEQVAMIMRMEQVMIDELLMLVARFMVDRTNNTELQQSIEIQRFFEVTIKKYLPKSIYGELQEKYKQD